jgi:hypothetical protein
MTDRYTAMNMDTHGEVWDRHQQRMVSRHALIRDAEAEAARLNAEAPKWAAQRLYTEAEVAAREAAAAAEMRETCAAWCAVKEQTSRSFGSHADAYEIAARNIRALPLPAPDALARMLAEAKRAGMEEAAKWHDEQAAYCSKRAAERMAEGHRSAFGALKTVQATHENSAAAIRARMERRTCDE